MDFSLSALLLRAHLQFQLATTNNYLHGQKTLLCTRVQRQATLCFRNTKVAECLVLGASHPSQVIIDRSCYVCPHALEIKYHSFSSP